ncbi:phosphotransferase RcsD [Chimaeribacter californicus]|uniref:Phosphotransferase RcsD n=1 Tax=Chimaeribacter californicus TaxID=2060067 RepID=A0A2N5EE81_9GAMM|nr:phosphotransferase RcsD [Chimaeribacter californicus]PLR40845.1 phosphotransferase RcsD [Chimaeribacter californicus]
MQKYLSLTSTNITRFFLVFILLLTTGIGIYGYNYTTAYLNDKKHVLENIATRMQQRIDIYRYNTYQIYDNYTGSPVGGSATPAQEIRLRPDVFYVQKAHRKTDAVIFGNHDSATLDLTLQVSNYLDMQWGGKPQTYTMYYLNGQDNSLIMVTTQPLQELTSRFKENYLTTSADARRNEMLQQANTLDERESFSTLRKSRFSNDMFFSLRTTFNNPGHLATVIAFDLPVNDLLPANLARANFQLREESAPVSEGEAEDNGSGTRVTRSGWWLDFATPLANAPLQVVYRVALPGLALDMLHNNTWLLLINLALLGMAMSGIYFIRHQFIRPSENMAAQLRAQQALNQEIVSSLSTGLLVYNFGSNSVVASNKIADHLLPHLSLQKIAAMAEQHHGTIQATVNNEVYEIRMLRSKFAPETYLFLLHDQDKEVMVNKKLQQARREYEKNLQARKLMLHNLGIELNQPLNTIHTLSTALQQAPEAERQQMLGDLAYESQSVLTLIDNITLLTRLETQDWQPSRHQFSLSGMVDELLLETLPALNRKGLSLFNHFQLDATQNYIGDVQALKKVLSLLLDYAIVTTAFGKISLIVESEPQQPEQLIFHITDTGSGISKEEIRNLNYPFLSQTLIDRFNHGSGLTFFLCNQLCKKLNGQLEIRSKADIGTRYTVRILLGVEPRDEEESEKLLDDVTVLLDVTSEEVRSIVTRLLAGYGANCITAEDRQISRDYDVMLTDNPHHCDRYTLLLSSDEAGFQQLQRDYIRVNYNISSAVIDAILVLIEQQMAATVDSPAPETLPGDDGHDYRAQLEASDYYALFTETVPEDLDKLHSESRQQDFTALSQTAHRLKGVFAMLNLTPGKVLCETLEQHIVETDMLKIENNISQIDHFVSRLLQQGSQNHE